MASPQDGVVLAGMSLCGADVADAAVAVIVVVPMDERDRPPAGGACQRSCRPIYAATRVL